MEPAQLLDELATIAREAGLEVRVLSGDAGGELPPQSAVCRVRERIWVVLAESDPPERRLAVLAQALRRHAPEALEGRYLPPALRELLDLPE
jgi:hypothetical protein